jgi:iron complex outermembrane recepter protein
MNTGGFMAGFSDRAFNRLWGARESRVLGRITTALLALVAATAEARAADTPQTDDTALAEVVVTTRYTTETVQETPISVAVINNERLQQQGITNLSDLAQMTSSVEFANPGSVFGKAMGAFIRGVGQADFIPGLQPGVGIYIDDVYYGQLTELGDTDRIEILKGPLGDESGFVEVGVGDFTQRLIKGAFDVPILDNLFFRVAA